MKKQYVSAVLICVFLVSPFFSASYADNPYQKQAREYSLMAQQSFDAGEYDKSSEYSAEAEKNAELSRTYIEKMVAKAEAEKQMNAARTRLRWAEGIRADKNYPMSYSAAVKAVADGTEAYNNEEYKQAAEYAKNALEALASVKEVTPLPKYYVVRPWEETRDCFWNIAGRSYVYNNPTLWENLYQANKSSMRKPDNPNLIFPGMTIEIPSISGEYREGVYNPSIKYEPFGLSR